MNNRQLKKLNKRILNEYQWWDQTYLLQLMHLWADNASKKHLEEGHLLRSNKTSKQLKTFSQVLKRLIDDEYVTQGCKVFKGKNFPKCGFLGVEIAEYINYGEKLRQQDVKLLTDLMNKHLLTWWD
jgi:hypothetical protein